MILPQILCSQLIFPTNIQKEIRVALALGDFNPHGFFRCFFKPIRLKPYSVVLNPIQVYLFLYKLKFHKIIFIANYLEIRIYLQ